MSLGYSGLLADIYWTRVVQYFGSKHRANAKQYLILEPLLEMTTTLDPKLLPAYQFGSVFLAQKPPEGAGNPVAATRLVEKGIRENPQSWRLYYDLGYIYWLELKDPAKAANAFDRGSKIAGAQPWMRVMAAALAAHAGETETAIYMWTNILNSTEDPDLRANAINRLRCLQGGQRGEAAAGAGGRVHATERPAARRMGGVDLGRLVAPDCRSTRRGMLTSWWAGGYRLRGLSCFRSSRGDCHQDRTPETCPAKRDSRSCETNEEGEDREFLLLLVCGPALRAQAHGPDARQAAARIDARYNGMKSLRADFTEIYSGGGIRRSESGTLWIKKPAKMRWEYSVAAEQDLCDRWRHGLVLRSGRAPGEAHDGEKAGRLALPVALSAGAHQAGEGVARTFTGDGRGAGRRPETWCCAEFRWEWKSAFQRSCWKAMGRAGCGAS